MPHQIIGPGSIDRRPDAFSSSYLFAHTFGPIQIADFTQGLYVRIWRVRADNATGTVYLCRNNDANDAWEAETVLFNYAGAPFLEMDAAFDQQGRIFVCVERATGAAGASEVWAYYFNGLVGDYVLEMKGPGRTPKALLDDTFDTLNADVLLFYMNDAIGMCYRYQRDRYNTEYVVSFAASAVPVDVNGGDNEAPVGPLHWQFAPGVYMNDPTGGTFTQCYTDDVPGYAITADARGAYVPFPATVIGGRQADMYGYHQPDGPEMPIEFRFAPPITGLEATIIGQQFAGDTLTWYAVAGDYAHPGGSVVFPAVDTGGDPEVRRGVFAASIGMIIFLPSAGNRTRLKNINVRLNAPAVAIPLPAGIPQPAPITYIEDLYKATDGRVHILYSIRDLAKGQYNLYHYETLLYPIIDRTPAEITTTNEFGTGHTLLVVLIQLTVDPESVMIADYIAPGGDLHNTLITHTLFDVEGIASANLIAAGGTLVFTGPITITLYDKEGIMSTNSIAAGGTLIVTVINHTLFDKEGIMPSNFIAAGGTLV